MLEENIANDDGKPTLEKRDFFIPSMDINYIQMQRRLNKIVTENSSEIKGGGINSSQRSNSLISGDHFSEATRFG